MDKVKVNDFVNAYSRVLNLDNYTRDILLELMGNIIQKYEKIIPNVPVSMDQGSVYLIKPQNGKYSVEDFFLNRLMRNVWVISEINQSSVDMGLSDAHTKGQFIASNQELSLNYPKLDKQLETIKEKLESMGRNYEKAKSDAKKKVIMHEFEHALQTKYDDKLEFRTRYSYSQISDELEKMKKYSNIIRTYDEIPKELGDSSHYVFCGTHCSSSLENKLSNTYREVNGFDNLNEILNESESLEMSGYNLNVFSILDNNSGNMFPLRNWESSNSSITNYGDLFKTIFGKQNSFSLMYLNPIEGFKKFNSEYNDIFQAEYSSNKDAIELFITAITEIKKTNSEEDHLKLNATLAKCLHKKVEKDLNNPKVSNERMLSVIQKFEDLSITNGNNNLRNNLLHIQILNNLKTKINNRNVIIQQTNPIIDISFEQLKEYCAKYELDVDEQQNIITLDRATGEVITDPKICTIANFANIWLTSAGVKTVDGRYEDYAFNDEAKYTYDFIKLQCKKQLEKDGKISPLDVLKTVDQLNYKHAEEIVSRLFGFYSQPQIVNDFFKMGTPNAKPYDRKIDEFILNGQLVKISDVIEEKEEIETLSLDDNDITSSMELDEHMRAAMEFNVERKRNSIDDDREDREHMLMAREMAALRSQTETDENMELWEHMLDARRLEVTNSEIQSAIERAERKFKLSNMSKEELDRYFESEIEKTTDPKRLGELRREMLANRIKDSDDATKSSDSDYSGPHLAQTPVVPNNQKGNNNQQAQNSNGKQNGQSQFYNYSNNQSSRRFDDSSSKKQEEQRSKTQPSNDNDQRNAEYNKQNEERRRQFLMNELMRFGMDELQRYLQHEQDVQKRNEFSLMLSELEERKKQQAIDEQKQNSSQSHYHGMEM